MDKEYLLEKPQGRCNKTFINKNYPDEYMKILEYPGLKFSEKLYNYLYDCPKHICPTCGKETPFRTIKYGYFEFCCVECSYKSKSRLNKIKNTIKERYGVENVSQNEIIKQKKKETITKNYGGIGWASKELSDRSNQTIKERYGVENVSQNEIIKQKKKETTIKNYGGVGFQIESIKQKANDKLIKKYGVSSVWKLEEYREKSKNTRKKLYGDESYNNSKKRKVTKLEKYGDENYSNPDKRKKTCLEKYGDENYTNPKKISQTKKNKIIENYDFVLGYDEYNNWVCKCPHPECNKCVEKNYIISHLNYYNRTLKNLELCTKLAPVNEYKCTVIEVFIHDILEKYNIKYESNIRNIISPYELDIYIPFKNIAIECNGVYWHCDMNKEKEYHYNKYIKCQEKGIQLISIWEDQIMNNSEKVQSIILSKLGIYKERIYARNCLIKEVPSKECNNFLEKYHLQGKTNSSIRLGLYYNDELLSIMTFGKGRKCLNSKTRYELYRYCCKEGTQIIGGASKLFKYFLKEYNPESIESFSSNDISNGNLYQQLGFEKVSDSVGYWYIDKDMNRYHRYSFRKQELIKEGYDKDKTEFEIMDERGFYRIYDSGQTKWTYTNNKK